MKAKAHETPAKYYFTYRGNACDGSVKIQFLTPETYVSDIGFRRDGKDRDLSICPGGYNPKGTPFEPENVGNFYLLLSGTGDLVIYEIGVVYRGFPKPANEELAPVDVDAVRLFPEPRIWRQGKGTVRLKACSPAQAYGKGTSRAAEWFNGEVMRFHGDVFADTGKPIVFALSDTPEGRAAIVDFGLREDVGNVVHDGFAIAVSERGIVVVGREPMGVMNGVRALMRLVHQYTGDAGDAQVGLVTVVDWPP